MRELVLKLHLVVSLIAGLFLVVLGLTGSIMAFETELEDLSHARLAYVHPGPRLSPLADIAAVVSKEFPGEQQPGHC
jgi:uncharacterized iron-regulated membrane protein